MHLFRARLPKNCYPPSGRGPPDDRIVMKIFVTKNDVAEQTPDGPALSINEAETEILMDDGDTVVFGGLVGHQLAGL